MLQYRSLGRFSRAVNLAVLFAVVCSLLVISLVSCVRCCSVDNMGIVKCFGFRSALEYVVVDCQHVGCGCGKMRVNWVLVLESCSSRCIER